MYDPTIGRWLSEDPIGFNAGDGNLYRYVGNNSINASDPSGLEQLPSDKRGKWVEGTRGNGVFEYSDIAENRAAGVAGVRVRFKNQCIGVGGFPAECYYEGSAAAATVEIKTVKGTKADFTAADNEMRRTRGDPNWKRPRGYTWNHAGEPGSTTMELVKKGPHGAVAHQGAAAEARAALRSASAGSVAARANAALAVYITARDALQAAGILQQDYDALDSPYYFLSEDRSVFIVQTPALLDFFSSPKRVFVAGPHQGETELITSAEVERYKTQAEEKWGKYVPGSLIHEPRFIPGTERQTLPLYDSFGRKTGFVDEKGVHKYPDWTLGGGA